MICIFIRYRALLLASIFSRFRNLPLGNPGIRLRSTVHGTLYIPESLISQILGDLIFSACRKILDNSSLTVFQLQCCIALAIYDQSFFFTVRCTRAFDNVFERTGNRSRCFFIIVILRRLPEVHIELELLICKAGLTAVVFHGLGDLQIPNSFILHQNHSPKHKQMEEFLVSEFCSLGIRIIGLVLITLFQTERRPARICHKKVRMLLDLVRFTVIRIIYLITRPPVRPVCRQILQMKRFIVFQLTVIIPEPFLVRCLAGNSQIDLHICQGIVYIITYSELLHALKQSSVSAAANVNTIVLCSRISENTIVVDDHLDKIVSDLISARSTDLLEIVYPVLQLSETRHSRIITSVRIVEGFSSPGCHRLSISF